MLRNAFKLINYKSTKSFRVIQHKVSSTFFSLDIVERLSRGIFSSKFPLTYQMYAKKWKMS